MATPWLVSLFINVALCANYWLLCSDWARERARRARLVVLVLSGATLALVPAALGGIVKALRIQVAGAYAANFLRAVEYVVVHDPAPQPRTPWTYLVAVVQDTFVPPGSTGGTSSISSNSTSGKGTSNSASCTNGTARTAGGGNSGGGSRSAAAATTASATYRQPLAPPGASLVASAARLAAECCAQYLLYDALLVLFVRRWDAASTPLFSVASIRASLAFAAVLYLHFAVTFKAAVLGLALLQPSVLREGRQLFAEPWRGFLSVRQLWQRWHQCFRTSFVRLAYRPTRAAVRALARRCSRLPGPAAASAASAAKLTPLGGALLACSDAVGVMAVFVMSGALHEYMCWAAFGSAFGLQLAFFALHGAAVLIESFVEQLLLSRPPGAGAGPRGSPGAAAARRLLGLAGAAAAVAFCAATSVLFMRPWLVAGYHHDFWHPFSPVTWAAGHVRWLERLGAAAGSLWFVGQARDEYGV